MIKNICITNCLCAPAPLRPCAPGHLSSCPPPYGNASLCHHGYQMAAQPRPFALDCASAPILGPVSLTPLLSSLSLCPCVRAFMILTSTRPDHLVLRCNHLSRLLRSPLVADVLNNAPALAILSPQDGTILDCERVQDNHGYLLSRLFFGIVVHVASSWR